MGLPGAVLLGLGSILGTGVFVSIGIAAGVAGSAVLLAIVLAAGLATLNGLSSAQLAARHPVSGGTYEYGYRRLTPFFGFTAGWAFLCAKSASAASAALGFAGYLLNALQLPPENRLVPIAAGTVIVLTVVVLSGMRRSNRTNTAIVFVTLISLVFFVVAGLTSAVRGAPGLSTGFFPAENPTRSLLHATALMFVAYTGYGRIATLGEEVREPSRTIPRAIVLTLLLTMVLYAAVGFVAVAAAGPDVVAGATDRTAAPLEVVARGFPVPGAGPILAVGAMAAMLGVLLNLLLGLSRVLLAMGRRGDAPKAIGRLGGGGTTPSAAVLVTGGAIFLLTLIGSVRTTWSFSAFTVLVYYAITNLAALRLSREERLYPRWVAVAGLSACLFLAFQVEREIWLVGLGVLGVGWIFHGTARRRLAGVSGPPSH